MELGVHKHNTETRFFFSEKNGLADSFKQKAQKGLFHTIFGPKTILFDRIATLLDILHEVRDIVVIGFELT